MIMFTQVQQEQDINSLNELCKMIGRYKQNLNVSRWYINDSIKGVKAMPFNTISAFINAIHKHNNKKITDVITNTPATLENIAKELEQKQLEYEKLLTNKKNLKFSYKHKNKKSEYNLQYTQSTLSENEKILNEIENLYKEIIFEEKKQEKLNNEIVQFKKLKKSVSKYDEDIKSLKEKVKDYPVAIEKTKENFKNPYDSLTQFLREKIKNAIKKAIEKSKKHKSKHESEHEPKYTSKFDEIIKAYEDEREESLQRAARMEHQQHGRGHLRHHGRGRGLRAGRGGGA